MTSVVSRKLMVPVILVSLAVSVSMVYSHCQIPCGIYDDPARFVAIAEHIATIEKSVNQINELSQEQKPNFNQLVRWVQNKEQHADELSEIVTYYFMAQRVKPVDASEGAAYRKYIRQVTLLHEMLVYGMKAKQTTDLANVEKLRMLLAEFRAAYLGDSEHKH